MTERNPYEKDETVDIPDFPSIKDEDEDIDRSIFKMSEDEDASSDEEVEEEYEEEEPVTYLRVKKSAAIVAVVIMAALLVLAIFGVVWGVSRNSKLATLQTEYDTYKATATATETSLNAKITELESQISSNTSNNGSSTTTETGETYKVGQEIDTINIRKEASSSSDRVKRSDLSSAVQEATHESEDGYAYVQANSTFTVYETKDVGDQTWARIDTNAWVCIKNGDETWAVKQ